MVSKEKFSSKKNLILSSKCASRYFILNGPSKPWLASALFCFGDSFLLVNVPSPGITPDFHVALI